MSVASAQTCIPGLDGAKCAKIHAGYLRRRTQLIKTREIVGISKSKKSKLGANPTKLDKYRLRLRWSTAPVLLRKLHLVKVTNTAQMPKTIKFSKHQQSNCKYHISRTTMNQQQFYVWVPVKNNLKLKSILKSKPWSKIKDLKIL
jgi:hypothetical protein